MHTKGSGPRTMAPIHYKNKTALAKSVAIEKCCELRWNCGAVVWIGPLQTNGGQHLSQFSSSRELAQASMDWARTSVSDVLVIHLYLQEIPSCGGAFHALRMSFNFPEITQVRNIHMPIPPCPHILSPSFFSHAAAINRFHFHNIKKETWTKVLGKSAAQQHFVSHKTQLCRNKKHSSALGRGSLALIMPIWKKAWNRFTWLMGARKQWTWLRD